MKVSVDSSTTNLVFPEFQGTLSVMLICTVLEFCLAVLAAVVWWKKAHSNFTGVSVLACLPKSCQVYLQFWVVLSNVSKTGRRVSSRRLQDTLERWRLDGGGRLISNADGN